jgi:hypothetical protein
VFRYRIAPDPAGRVVATLLEVRSQDSASVPGTSEDGDGFGSVLAATARGGVLVGTPDEDVASIKDAGTVTFLRVNSAGSPITSQSWSQNSPGVPGNAEKNDHFGAALGSRGLWAAVGVPDENSGSKVNSGVVQTFRATSATGSFVPAAAISQNSPGIPGSIEAGDRFGAAVAVGVALICQESTDLAVGAPGEDIGTRKNAGNVTLVTLSGDDCPARVRRQGSGLAGAAEAGDQVGSVLGLIRGRIDLEEDYADKLMIGVPKEDLGAKADAGMVQPATGAVVANGVVLPSLKFSKGYLLTDNYGMVLPTASD